MCWNPKVSLFSYLFSAIPLFILTFYYNKYSFYNFLAFHSWISMQLVEMFLWFFLNNPVLNTIFSIIGFIAIISQPFFMMLSIDNFSYKKTLLLLYVFIVSLYITFYKIEFKTTIATNNHLKWNWLDIPLYIALLWVFFFSFRPAYLYYINPTKNKIELYTLICILSSFTISYITFMESKTWASMWCWIANISAIYNYWLLLTM